MYVDQSNAKPNVTLVRTSLRTLINTDTDGLFGIVKAAQDFAVKPKTGQDCWRDHNHILFYNSQISQDKIEARGRKHALIPFEPY